MATNNSITGKTVIPSYQTLDPAPTGRAYRGISTISDPKGSYTLYDLSLIKQDLINHLHIRQGEKLENPEFGCIIWDLLFDPLTDDLKDVIAENVTEIMNYDPRVKVDSLIVSQFESGIQVECELTYLPYNISEAIKFRFDQDNNILS
jgi:phage baseplate assembly protein W